MSRKGEKPKGEAAGWHLLGSKTAFENEICRLREDEVELKGGKKTKYAYVERDEAVIIVPITSAGEMVLLKQYRYPVDDWCLEVPAGGTHDACDAALEEVARKELREEVGATAKSLKYVDFFYSSNSTSDEKCHVFLAEGVDLGHDQKTEATESIETQLVPVATALELVRDGRMKTGPSALAVLLCESLLAKFLRSGPTPDDLLET